MNFKEYKSKNSTHRIAHSEPLTSKILSEKLISCFPSTPCEYVAVFIGTDRSTGDALGPLAGSSFLKMKPKHISIYGTLHNPVHAVNLQSHLEAIYKKHNNPFVIAIDACLGKSTSVGELIAGVGPIKPGAALNKPLPLVGDVHITGVVNISGFMEYAVLQNTRLSLVSDMAHSIAHILNCIDQQLTTETVQPAVLIRSSSERPVKKLS